MGELILDFRYNEVWDKKALAWSCAVDVTVGEYERVPCTLHVSPDLPDPMAKLAVDLPELYYATVRSTDPLVRQRVYEALRFDTAPLVDCLHHAVKFVPTLGPVNYSEAVGGCTYVTVESKTVLAIHRYPGSPANIFIVRSDKGVGHYEYDYVADTETAIIPLDGQRFKAGYFRNLDRMLDKQHAFIEGLPNALFGN